MSEELQRPLSDREWEIARLVGKGKSYKAIGQELGINKGTVRAHANNIAHVLPRNGDETLPAYRRVMLWIMHRTPSSTS